MKVPIIWNLNLNSKIRNTNTIAHANNDIDSYKLDIGGNPEINHLKIRVEVWEKKPKIAENTADLAKKTFLFMEKITKLKALIK